MTQGFLVYPFLPLYLQGCALLQLERPARRSRAYRADYAIQENQKALVCDISLFTISEFYAIFRKDGNVSKKTRELLIPLR
jgi:hypothetical protein